MKAQCPLYHLYRALRVGRTAPIGRLAPSKFTGLHLCEMAFESQPRDDMDVFSLRSTLRSPRFDVLSALRVACREDCSDWLNLELSPRVACVVVAVFVVACRELRCDWSNLELSPPSNVPGLHSGEMAFESEPPEVTDVFSLRSTLRSLTNRRPFCTGSLKGMSRNEGAVPFILCRALHAGRTALIG